MTDWADENAGALAATGSLTTYMVAQALREARAEGVREGLERAAKRLDAAAEHQAKVDQHPAWDRTRQIKVDPCHEPGHAKYHSFFGCAAHILAQMATVVRADAETQSGEDYRAHHCKGGSRGVYCFDFHASHEREKCDEARQRAHSEETCAHAVSQEYPTCDCGKWTFQKGREDARN